MVFRSAKSLLVSSSVLLAVRSSSIASFINRSLAVASCDSSYVTRSWRRPTYNNTIKYNTIQYNTMQCNTMQCNITATELEDKFLDSWYTRNKKDWGSEKRCS